MPIDTPTACSVPHGSGLTRCEWDGTTTCVAHACDTGYVLDDATPSSCIALDTTLTSCVVEHGTGRLVDAACFTIACDAGYAQVGGGCVCLGQKTCSGAITECAISPCVVAAAPTPPPTARQLSSDAARGSVSAWAAALFVAAFA